MTRDHLCLTHKASTAPKIKSDGKLDDILTYSFDDFVFSWMASGDPTRGRFPPAEPGEYALYAHHHQLASRWTDVPELSEDVKLLDFFPLLQTTRLLLPTVTLARMGGPEYITEFSTFQEWRKLSPGVSNINIHPTVRDTMIASEGCITLDAQDFRALMRLLLRPRFVQGQRLHLTLTIGGSCS